MHITNIQLVIAYLSDRQLAYFFMNALNIFLNVRQFIHDDRVEYVAKEAMVTTLLPHGLHKNQPRSMC